MSASDSPANATVGWSALQIAAAVRSGVVKAVDVLDAHLARIREVNPRINAVVVECAESARRAAERVDAVVAKGLDPGPLAGVPLTIKDCFHVAGTTSSIGVVRFAGEVIQDDGPLVARLRAAGAIIVGKTNVPQLMVLNETVNPVYGRTEHPFFAGRSPGGSSGGEAAIIAAGGVPAGLGSDMGGSIRQPAHSCGIAGLKPTIGRLTNQGCRNSFNGMQSIGVAPGPLARRVEDVELLMQSMCPTKEQALLDETPSPLPTLAASELVGMRAGVWTADGLFDASPAVRRASQEAADALRDAGVKVEPFEPPNAGKAFRLCIGLIGADGGSDARRLIGGGARDPQVRMLMRLGRLPRSLRNGFGAVLSLIGQRGAAGMLRATGPRSAAQYWRMTQKLSDYQHLFFAEMDARRLDLLICPPYGLPALTHGSFQYLTSAASYAMLANVLGVPAGVVPVTNVRSGEESDRKASSDVVQRAALAVEAGSAGLPVGAQILARPWREDIVLAAMRAIELRIVPEQVNRVQ